MADSASPLREHAGRRLPQSRASARDQSVLLQAPDHEYYCYLEFILTVTTPEVLSATFSRSVDPLVSMLNMLFSPAGLALTAASDSLPTPFPHLAVVNSGVTIIAPSPQTVNGQQYVLLVGAQATCRWTLLWRLSGPLHTRQRTYWLQPRNRGWPGPTLTWAVWGLVATPQSGDSGSVTLYGSGEDIWDVADGGHFRACTDITGDVRIVAQLQSLSAAAFPNAKAGVMLRPAIASGSQEVSLLVSGMSWVGFHWRPVANEQTNYQWLTLSNLPNQYLRLDRIGNVFQSYISTDGTTWSLVHSYTASLPDSVHVGVVVTSHDQSGLCEAAFSKVQVTHLRQRR